MCLQAAPIVRVAVEAALPSELPRLLEGLRLLNRADPFLEVTLQDKGEYVLGAAGVHAPTLGALQDKGEHVLSTAAVHTTLVQSLLARHVLCPAEKAVDVLVGSASASGQQVF